ncbi:MAG: DUF554 domain-containing protein [Eubacteriales bacterium]
MLGPIVNAITIIICALVGTFLIKNIPERFDEIIRKGIGICLLYMGIKGAMENQRVMLLILSIVIGSIIGEMIDFDKGMNKIGEWAESKIGLSQGKFSKGFVMASLLFCTGSMAIVGSLNSGLSGNYEMLFAKSILDGVISIVFGSTLGIGVAFSAVPVFLYEGIMTLGASFVKDWLTPEIIREMSAVGSLLICALGLNFLEIRQIKVANMIPAIFIPWIYIGITSMF